MAVLFSFTSMKYHKMSPDHLDEVLSIESDVSKERMHMKWTKAHFIDAMFNINKSCLVVTKDSQPQHNHDTEIIGFAVCYHNELTTCIENLSVRSTHLRNGCGTALIKFVESVSRHGNMLCNVSERLAPMHLLLKKNKYACSSFYVNDNEYYYTFTKKLIRP